MFYIGVYAAVSIPVLRVYFIVYVSQITVVGSLECYKRPQYR